METLTREELIEAYTHRGTKPEEFLKAIEEGGKQVKSMDMKP